MADIYKIKIGDETHNLPFLPLSGGTLTGEVQFDIAGLAKSDICTGVIAAFKASRIQATDLICNTITLGVSSGSAPNLPLTIRKYSKVTNKNPDGITNLVNISTDGVVDISSSLRTRNFLRIDTTDYAGNYGYLKPETYVASGNTNRAVLRIGSNYGGNSNMSLGTEALDAINIYRGVVGIGGTFTGDTLYQQQKDGISLAVNGKMTVNGNLVSVDGHTHDYWTWKTAEVAAVKVNNAVYADSAGSAPASDVYSWAKATTKPSYKTSEVTEETNLYFTNQRAIDACSGTYLPINPTNLNLHGDWTNDFGIHFKEGGSDNYGFSLCYGSADKFRLYTRNDAVNVEVFNVERGSTTVVFASTPKVGSDLLALAKDIPTIPSSLPASDVYAWAKAATKPSYKTSEVTEETNLYFTNQRAINACSGTYMPANDTSHGTHVTDGAQTWSGIKTFSSEVIFDGGGTKTDICPDVAAAFKTKRIMANQIIADSIILGASSGTASNKNLTIQKYDKVTSTAPDALTTLLTFDTKGRIRKTSGGSWISARDNTIIMQEQTNASGSSYNPIIGTKTQAGFWSMGSCGGETLYLSYDTDENYNSGNNTSKAILFPAAGSTGTIALTSDIPTSLPANGGNADTVGGKSASDFATASHSHSNYINCLNNHSVSTTYGKWTRIATVAGSNLSGSNLFIVNIMSHYASTVNHTMFLCSSQYSGKLSIKEISPKHYSAIKIRISSENNYGYTTHIDITPVSTGSKTQQTHTISIIPIGDNGAITAKNEYVADTISGSIEAVSHTAGAITSAEFYKDDGTSVSYEGHTHNYIPTGGGVAIGSSSKRFTNGYFSGSVYAASGFYESSDEKLKDIQAPLTTDLEKLSHLRKVYFNFKEDPSKTHIGVIAQDIKELYPEIVNETDEGTLNVDYSKLSVIALDAVDQLHKENEEIKKRLEKLESLLLNQ